MERVWVYLITLLATVFCAAVNAYTVQVAYPLWASVGAAEFGALHREYLRRLWPVITLPHVVMFFASAAMIFVRPWFVSRSEAMAVFALDAGVVAVSAFVAGPVHTRFEQQGIADAGGLHALIVISAVRVGMMLAACWVLCVSLLRALSR
jgi:hypothetical protein